MRLPAKILKEELVSAQRPRIHSREQTFRLHGAIALIFVYGAAMVALSEDRLNQLRTTC